MTYNIKRIELPWAFATRRDPERWAPGNAYRYFITSEDAEKSLAWMEKRRRYHGPIEYRTGECYESAALDCLAKAG